MLYRLLTIIFIFCAFSIQAQKKDHAKAKPVPAPIQAKIDYTQLGTPMPQMLLVTMDTVAKTIKNPGTWWSRLRHKNITVVNTNKFTNEDFVNDANLIVMMFNPTCGHCIEETEVLKRNIDLFHKTQLILMANGKMREYLIPFIRERELKKFPSIKVGLDSANFVNEAFLYRNLPQINIYNPERKLIKIYNGDVAIDSLKQYIQ